MTRMLVVVAAILLLAGCSQGLSARHVVVDPGQAASLNSADWIVKRQPQSAESKKKDGQ